MEFEQSTPSKLAMTFDEVSMERSKSFVRALQELKNLRPQLHSAAVYCEKSYLHNEQKEMVLENVKDYAVRALVNAVDHLGTVAYKLTDLIVQQTFDLSTVELKVSCLNQKLLACHTYTNKEGFRQQQLLAFIPRHHKHYILPNSVYKKVHIRPHEQTNARQTHFQARPHLQPSGTPAPKTLSWHLASETETETTLTGTPKALTSTEDPKKSDKTSRVFQLLDNEDSVHTKSSSAHLRLPSGDPAFTATMQTFGVSHRDPSDGSKSLIAFRSFDNPNRRQIVPAYARSRSMLAAFFIKRKTPKLKTPKLKTPKLKTGA